MSRTNRSNKLFEQTRIATLGLQDLLAFGQLQPDGTYKVRNVTNSNFLNAIVISEQITHAELLALATASELVAGKNYTITDAVSGTLSLYIFAVSTSKLAEYGYDTTTGQVYSYDLVTDTATNADNTGYINFTPQTAPAYQRGRVWYDSTTETLSVYDDISGTSVQLGQEEILRARNSTGSTILNGAVVYVSGAQGQNPRVSLALANAASTSRVIGVATHNISNNSVGKITTFGIVGDLNTSAYNEGDVLYLSASVAGGFTTTRPSAPNQAVMVGTVIHAAVNDGKILVHTDNYGVGFGTANQVRGMNAAGTAEEYKTIQGTASEVEVLHTANTVTIGLPNAVTISGAMTAGSFVKSGGVSAQFLKADGTVDANAYFYTNAQVTGQALTGLSVSGSAVVSTDSILTGIGKLQNQINAVLGSVNFQGVWNASTNTPTLTSSVGTKGYYYIVTVAGSTNLDGITDWKLGDWAIYDGTAWQKVDNTDAVVSVNGYTGIVTLAKADIGLGNVENTALSTWAGSTNITTLGTISSGVWNGTAIGDTYISSASTWNAKIGGSGTTGKLAKFTSSGAVGDSIVSESGGTLLASRNNSIVELRLQSLAPYAYPADFTIQAGGYSIPTLSIYDNTTASEKLTLSATELITFGAPDTGEAHIFGGSARVNGNTLIRGNATIGGSGNPSITIEGTDPAYSSILELKSAGAGQSYIGATNVLHLVTGSTERLTITSSGNVGIGTTSPSEKLHISGGNIIVNSSQAIGWGDRSTQLVGVTGASGYLRFDTNDLERMRLASTGNLLIGTQTDDGVNKLQVSGSAKVKSTGYGTIASFLDASDSGIKLVANASVGYNEIISDGNQPFLITVNSAERFRIAGNGAATFSSSVTAASITSNGTIATGGDIYMPNNYDIYFRNSANSAWVNGIGISNTDVIRIGNGKVRMPSLPTSSAGLSAGDIWNDSGTLKIV